MKKNEEEKNMAIVKRSDKKAFYGVASESATVYHRMSKFTEISTSKNPVEYSRQYVDEDFEVSDVIGYAPSVSIAFDLHTDNAVHKDIAEIYDKEKTGDDAVREIITVDFTQPVTGSAGHYKAYKRSFAVIPGDEGGDTDRYGYSASLKAKSGITVGSAASNDEWQTVTFTEEQ